MQAAMARGAAQRQIAESALNSASETRSAQELYRVRVATLSQDAPQKYG